uniref:Putative V-type proton ATPase proteolipid subunit n=1 Tax=Davidia involucrata TaxID=16924 RepID=A0A5B7C7K5_DAVIN
MSSTFSGDETAPFFGFLGAAAALVFSCMGAAYGTAKSGVNPKAKSYYLFDGYAHLSSGLACGLAGLSAGMAIGIVGDAGVRANAQQPKLFVGMILILIFAEALALYGLIVGIILSSRAGQSRAD